MRTQSETTKKILAHLEKHPQAKAAALAEKFNVHVSRIYQLRRKLAQVPVQDAPVEGSKILVYEPEDIVTSVDTVLDSRAQDYGAFKDGAALMQSLTYLRSRPA